MCKITHLLLSCHSHVAHGRACDQLRSSTSPVIDQAVILSWGGKDIAFRQSKEKQRELKEKSPLVDNSSFATVCVCVCVHVCVCAFWCLVLFCRSSLRVLNNSSCSASCLAQASRRWVEGVVRERQAWRNWHSCSPVRPRPDELIPWQCKLGWHNVSGELLPACYSRRALAFPEHRKN
jgi:hypothetical protein